MNCPTDSFQCRGGCISWDYVCDGIAHCQYGEDESICGKCVNNEYMCLDGTKMSCELSCTVLGSIPCVKYRNRITCVRDYPEAIGSYYRNNNKQSTMNNAIANNFFSNSYIFYILVALVILVLIIVGVIALYVVYKRLFQQRQLKKKQRLLSKTHKNSIVKKNDSVDEGDNVTLQLNIREITNSKVMNESLTKISADSSELLSSKNQQKFSKKVLYDDDDDDDHKYHEINDLSISSSSSMHDARRDLKQLFTTATDNNYANHDPNEPLHEVSQPPPYNKIHMFRNVNNNKNDSFRETPIQGKSTYV